MLYFHYGSAADVVFMVVGTLGTFSGLLKHDYTAQRTAKGLTLSRQHASVGTALRFHDKVPHICDIMTCR